MVARAGGADVGSLGGDSLAAAGDLDSLATVAHGAGGVRKSDNVVAVAVDSAASTSVATVGPHNVREDFFWNASGAKCPHPWVYQVASPDFW